MSTSSSSDIVLPMIQSHNGKSYTAGVVRKKSTPKIISTRRHFELYGRGDQRAWLKNNFVTYRDIHHGPWPIGYESYILVQIVQTLYRSTQICTRNIFDKFIFSLSRFFIKIGKAIWWKSISPSKIVSDQGSKNRWKKSLFFVFLFHFFIFFRYYFKFFFFSLPHLLQGRYRWPDTRQAWRTRIYFYLYTEYRFLLFEKQFMARGEM